MYRLQYKYASCEGRTSMRTQVALYFAIRTVHIFEVKLERSRNRSMVSNNVG